MGNKKTCRKHWGYDPNCIQCVMLNEKVVLPEKNNKRTMEEIKKEWDL